tara:strand:+ start:603 stop:1085 length:483 start_codon:yes stop_codon:yes gene_type:complete
MIVNFKSLNKNSRVWIFQSINLIDDQLVEIIKEKISLFLNKWKSHQRDFKSSFEIRHNTFIIVAADESSLVSGCSIDSLVNFIKDLENSYNLQLMDKLHVKYIENGKIITQHINKFKIHCQSLGKKDSLIVFNNLVKDISELENNWQVDIRDSWHNKYIK